MSMPQIPNARDGSVMSNEELDEYITRDILTSPLLSGHKADLSKFKNASGEFKRWLHIFHVSERPTFHDTNLKTTHVLPWCWDSDTVDIEFHRAVVALNGYKGYPMAWSTMSWRLEPLLDSPIYSVFASNPSQAAMLGAIKDATGFTPRIIPDGAEDSFWESMTQFLLVPTISGTVVPTFKRSTKPVRRFDHASIGLSKACPSAVREWGHSTPHRAAGLRKVPGDRE